MSSEERRAHAITSSTVRSHPSGGSNTIPVTIQDIILASIHVSVIRVTILDTIRDMRRPPVGSANKD